MEASAPLSNIPNDIIRYIVLQLPMKAVIRCQCVCKQWRSLIQDSDFKLSYGGQRRVIILSFESETQKDYYWNSRLLVRSTSLHDLRLQRHKWPFRVAAYPLILASNQYPVRALCSCNGVVLLVVERDIWLWNPTTRCSTKVLELPMKLNPIILAAGLCYDSCTRDYKAVLLLRRRIWPGHEFGDPFVIAASLNHKEWRPVQFPYNSTRGSFEFRNTFHWWASDIKDWDRDRDYLSGDYRNRILYFDPVPDEFRILPTPEHRENSIVGLGVINDCLSMACIVHKGEKSKIKTKTMQVLIMKEYGRQESWMTAFAMQMPELAYIHGNYCLTFYSQKKNAQEIVFMLCNAGWYGRQVHVYDRTKDELKEVRMDDFPKSSGRRYYVSLCFYVESPACLPR